MLDSAGLYRKTSWLYTRASFCAHFSFRTFDLFFHFQSNFDGSCPQQNATQQAHMQSWGVICRVAFKREESQMKSEQKHKNNNNNSSS